MSSQAWQYTTRGRLSQTLELVSRDVPHPKGDEVVIEVKAAALNPVDEQLAQLPDWQIKSLGVAPMGTPFVPCADFAGIVHSVGDDVKQWKVGQRVYGMRLSLDGNGSLQRYHSVKADAAFCEIPGGLSFAHAAAFPLVYTTAYEGLVVDGKLAFEPDASVNDKYSVLITGGSGGVGHVAIQMAKQMGLRVVATCSSKNIEMVKRLGADEVIDYTSQNVVQAALSSKHAPYAVVLDCVGGYDLVPHMDQLVLDDRSRPELGIYITIVGDKTSRDTMGGPATYYTNPVQVLRSLRGQLHHYLPRWIPFRSMIVNRRYKVILTQPTQAKVGTIATYLKRGGDIMIDSTYKFEEAKAAYARLETGRAKGKVVVEM